MSSSELSVSQHLFFELMSDTDPHSRVDKINAALSRAGAEDAAQLLADTLLVSLDTQQAIIQTMRKVYADVATADDEIARVFEETFAEESYERQFKIITKPLEED